MSRVDLFAGIPASKDVFARWRYEVKHDSGKSDSGDKRLKKRRPNAKVSRHRTARKTFHFVLIRGSEV